MIACRSPLLLRVLLVFKSIRIELERGVAIEIEVVFEKPWLRRGQLKTDTVRWRRDAMRVRQPCTDTRRECTCVYEQSSIAVTLRCTVYLLNRLNLLISPTVLEDEPKFRVQLILLNNLCGGRSLATQITTLSRTGDVTELFRCKTFEALHSRVMRFSKKFYLEILA